MTRQAPPARGARNVNWGAGDNTEVSNILQFPGAMAPAFVVDLDALDLPALTGCARTLTKLLCGLQDGTWALDPELAEHLAAHAERIARDLRRAAA